MAQFEILGKMVRDKLSGFEGFAVAKVEYLYGCSVIVVHGRVEKPSERPQILRLYEAQLEVLPEPALDMEIPEYKEPDIFGKKIRDKFQNTTGICIGRMISIFAEEQVLMERTLSDPDKESIVEYFDRGRIEVIEDAFTQEEVQGKHPGGTLPWDTFDPMAAVLTS